MAPSDVSIAPVVKIWNPPPNSRVVDSIRNVDPKMATMLREKAERLIRDERVIASGPVQKGNFVYIPSPCWQPRFVDECKQRGGRFNQMDGRLFGVWTLHIHRMTLDQACALYTRYFFREIAVSRNNLDSAEVGYVES